MGIKEKEEMHKTIQNQMQLLEQNARRSLEDMKYGIMRENDLLFREICELLSSPDVRAHICSWEPRDCPSTGNWKNVVKEAEEKIGKKINFEINMWDKDRRIVAGIKEKIVNKFKRDFSLMEDQMRSIEGSLQSHLILRMSAGMDENNTIWLICTKILYVQTKYTIYYTTIYDKT